MENFEHLKKMNILYIEDDLETLRLYSKFLSYYVAKVYQCNSSLKALEIFEDENIDLIITDMDMPQMDGIELIKKIRNNDKKVRIIVLTGYSDANYTIPSIELDVSRYLVKPVSKTALFEALQKCQNEIIGGDDLVTLADDTIFDLRNRELIIATQKQKLQKKPLHLLYLLVKNKEEILTYETITKELSSDKIISINSIRCHIRNLRRSYPQIIIKNSSGFGYTLQTKENNV